MKEESISTDSMLMNIGSMRGKAQALLGNGKAYVGLLRKILERDFYYDDEQPVPSLKGLCQEAGLSAGKARKYIEKIYFDLSLDYESKRPLFSFSEARYEFYLRGRGDKYLDFRADNLPVMPQVGAEMTIPFFSAYLGEAHFQVEEIRHDLEESSQLIKFYLRGRNCASYWAVDERQGHGRK